MVKLKSSFRTFYGRHHDYRSGISVSHMTRVCSVCCWHTFVILSLFMTYHRILNISNTMCAIVTSGAGNDFPSETPSSLRFIVRFVFLILVSCVVFYVPLYCLCSVLCTIVRLFLFFFFILPFNCPSFDLQILITPLAFQTFYTLNLICSFIILSYLT